MRLPGVTTLEAAGTKIQLRDRKIPHQKILAALQDSAGGSDSLVEIYRGQVLPIKTRSIHLLGKKAPARIITTLLGYEVQASYKRIHCPDMVTARYLKLFMEIGCRTIRLPYDPTVTARLIPALEASLERIVKGVRDMFPRHPAVRTYVLQRIFRILRARLRAD
jgi:hypothetical protein